MGKMKFLLLVLSVCLNIYNTVANPCPPIWHDDFIKPPQSAILPLMSDTDYQYIYADPQFMKGQRTVEIYYPSPNMSCQLDKIYITNCAGVITGGVSDVGGATMPWAKSYYPVTHFDTLEISFPECAMEESFEYYYPTSSAYDGFFPKVMSPKAQNMACLLWSNPDFLVYREDLKLKNINCFVPLPLNGPYHEIELTENLVYGIGNPQGHEVGLSIHGAFSIPSVTAHGIIIDHNVKLQNVFLSGSSDCHYLVASSDNPQNRTTIEGNIQFSGHCLKLRDIDTTNIFMTSAQRIESSTRFYIGNPNQRELYLKDSNNFTIPKFSRIGLSGKIENAWLGEISTSNYIGDLKTDQEHIAEIVNTTTNPVFFRMENLGDRSNRADIDKLVLKGAGQASFSNSYVNIKSLQVNSGVTLYDSHNIILQKIEGNAANNVEIQDFTIASEAHGDTDISDFVQLVVGNSEFTLKGTIKFKNIEMLEIKKTAQPISLSNLWAPTLSRLEIESMEDLTETTIPAGKKLLRNYKITHQDDGMMNYKIYHDSGRMEFSNVKTLIIRELLVPFVLETDTIVSQKTDSLTTVTFQPEGQTFIDEGVFTNRIHDIKVSTAEHELFFGRAYNSNSSSFGSMGAKWESFGQYRLFLFDEENEEAKRLEVSWGQGTATRLSAIGDSYVSTDGCYSAEITSDNEFIFLTKNNGTTYVFNNKPVPNSPLIENFIINRITGFGSYDLLYEYDEQTRLIRMGEVPKGAGNINQENPALEITYNQNNLIDCVSATGQETHCYDYDEGRLTGVSTPKSGYIKRYAYKEEKNPALLSELLDKNAEATGLITYNSQEQAISYTILSPQTLPTTIILLLGNEPLGEGYNIAVFDVNGECLDYTENTDATSRAVFQLEAGTYSFAYTYDNVEFQSHFISAGEEAIINIPTPTAVTVRFGNEPIGAGLTVYPFKAEGEYVGYTKITDENSKAYFNLPEGNYIFYYTHEGIEFSSGETAAFTETSITVPLTKVTVTIGEEIFLTENLIIMAFSETGEFLGLSENTDESGAAYFKLGAGNYKFTCTYSQQQYWSETATAFTQTSIIIPPSSTVTVFFNEIPVGADLQVQAFMFDGFPLDYTVITNAQSQAFFHLPNGFYKFRCTYENQIFWSNIIETPDQAEIQIFPTSVRLFRGVELFTPVGQNIKAFITDGTDLNYSVNTNEQSVAYFILPEGNYKFLCIYGDVEYWSAETSAFIQTSIIIPAQTTVNVTFNGEPIGSGFIVEAFGADEVELGLSATTDDYSTAYFTLPENSYKFRIIYEGATFWSAEIAATEQVNINIQPTTVTVWHGEHLPVSTLNIHAFTADEIDLDYVVTTTAQLVATFILPEGNYKFLCVYEGIHYWSADTPAFTEANIHLPVASTNIFVSRLGEPFTQPVTIEAFQGEGLELVQSKITDESGMASFILSAGFYSFRMEIEGVEHWISGLEAENNHSFPTRHTKVILRRDDKLLPPGQSCQLLINEQESDEFLYTDEESAIVVLPVEDSFRLRCSCLTGNTAVTDIVQAGSSREFDFIRQVIYQLHYSGIKPTDYNEQLCFEPASFGAEKCIESQENFTSIEAGNYEIVYRLRNQHYVLDSVSIVMSAEPEEFTLILPEIRQINLTNNDIPQTETELYLVRDDLEFSVLTNSNGHLFFVKSGEWQVFLNSVQLGVITAEQDFVHFNTDTSEELLNIDTSEKDAIFDSNDYEEEINNTELPLVLFSENTVQILNPSQLFYQPPYITLFNVPTLSLSIYSTANIELKFTLYKLSNHITTKSQVLRTFIFQISSGENELNWSIKDEDDLFYEPGDYYLQIEVNDEQEIRLMSYNEDLQLKSCSTIEFTIVY